MNKELRIKFKIIHANHNSFFVIHYLGKSKEFALRRTSLRENLVNVQGFTLIELLVVMAIIGLLVGISLFALAGARESARDGRRKSELETIRSALELYKADCNIYINASGNVGTVLDTESGAGVRLIGSGSPSTCLASNVYLEKIPNDSLTGVNYYYSGNGTTYQLCAKLEQPPTPADSCSGGANNCGTGATCNYRVNNP